MQEPLIDIHLKVVSIEQASMRSETKTFPKMSHSKTSCKHQKFIPKIKAAECRHRSKSSLSRMLPVQFMFELWKKCQKPLLKSVFVYKMMKNDSFNQQDAQIHSVIPRMPQCSYFCHNYKPVRHAVGWRRGRFKREMFGV